MKVGKCQYLALFQKMYNEWKQETSPLGPLYKPSIYTQGSASELEDCVKGLFKFIGRKAWKVDVKGTRRDIGGREMYVPTKSDKGVSDIFTVEGGLFIAIEIKYGKDRQSERQYKFEQDVKRQGGRYFIVKDFEDFLIQAHFNINLFGWRGADKLLPLYAKLIQNHALNVDNTTKDTK